MEGQITINAKPRALIDYQKPKAVLTIQSKPAASIEIIDKLKGEINYGDYS